MISLKGWLNGLLLAAVFNSAALANDSLNIAVAANFEPAMKKLVQAFETSGQAKIKLSYGSTGALYAQIRHGAPFDLFLAADVERAERLEKEGIALLRATYAIGRLVFWMPGTPVDRSTATNHRQSIAIANPRHAPYGTAALAVIRNLGMQPSTVIRGTSVAQAYSFVETGNTVAGLVALSQVQSRQVPADHYWEIPASLHEPVEQQYVLLRESAAAAAFAAFLQSEAARAIISRSGYRLPEQQG